MKPRWLRRNASCPNCGKVVTENDIGWKHIPYGTASYDCSICKAHYAWEDFWDENDEKWAVGGYSSRNSIDQ